MSRDSSGAYSLPGSVNPVVTLTTITSNWANTTLVDIGTELTNSLDRNGRGAMLAKLQLYAGTALLPGLTWGAETTSGRYRAASQDFREVVNSLEIARLQADGVYITDAAGGSPFIAGYRGIPIKTPAAGAYTFILTDNGKGLYKDDAADITVPPNASVAFPLGAAVSIYNFNAATLDILEGAAVDLYLPGSGTPGNRVLGAYSLATLWKFATDSWLVTGTDIS